MTGWSTLKKLIWLRIIKGGGSALRTVTGAIVHVTNALARPAISVKCEVNPIQDLHGYDSPWPAGGGKNLFQTTATTKTQSGVTWTINNDGSITASGTATDYTDLNAGEAIVAGLSETVTIYGDVSASGNIVFGTLKLVDANNQALETIYNGGTKTTHTVDLTQYSNAYKIVVTLKRNNNVATSGTYHIQVVKGTTVPAWSPYSNICPISGRTSATIYRSGADTSNPTTYTIQLGQTVYGGTLDVTGGKMVVDRAMADLGTLTWSRGGTDTAGIYRFSSNIPTVIAESGSAIPRMLCSQYATVSPNKTYQRVNGVSNNLNIGRVMVFDDAYSNGDVAAFKTAMSGVQLVYELATPIEITLTPTQIDMLLGENNVWADAGDLTLTYYADGNASTSEALGILLGGTYNNPGGADDVSDDEALGILLGGS